MSHRHRKEIAPRGSTSVLINKANCSPGAFIPGHDFFGPGLVRRPNDALPPIDQALDIRKGCCRLRLREVSNSRLRTRITGLAGISGTEVLKGVGSAGIGVDGAVRPVAQMRVSATALGS